MNAGTVVKTGQWHDPMKLPEQFRTLPGYTDDDMPGGLVGQSTNSSPPVLKILPVEAGGPTQDATQLPGRSLHQE